MKVPAHAVGMANLMLDGVVSQAVEGEGVDNYAAISLILDEIVNGADSEDDDRFMETAAVAIICISRLSWQLSVATNSHQLEVVANLRVFLESLTR